VEALMPDQPLLDEISLFFNDYIVAFDANDGAAIAPFYHVPSVSIRADGSTHCFLSQDELKSFFQSVTDRYHSEGYSTTRFDNLDVQPWGSKSAVATMEWQMLRKDASIIREWRQSYNLIRTDGRLKIFVSTFH
jgi:hypothetical protein